MKNIINLIKGLKECFNSISLIKKGVKRVILPKIKEENWNMEAHQSEEERDIKKMTI